ncbi:unnamed protein product [Adineta steineri]|uniref:Uncharacterized protein n=1 Tax=Adineta steineri TaxID=433720 RepID=A0A815MV19_9BILA|nr:unnamed protein product [Adineta steineri]CAF3908540.1 unnamed protein product [Adineta steineri]
MNIDNNDQEILKAPSEDIQNSPNEILSSIHIFTPQQQQRPNQNELCAIFSEIKPPTIDQYHENYSQQKVNDYETWLEDEYKEYIKQIEHIEELKEEEKQQCQLKLSEQLEDQEQWEEMLLQNLIILSEKQSDQDLYQLQQENNSFEYLKYMSRHKHQCTFVLARTDIEKSHFRVIQQALNKLNIRVRAVRQSNVLYICHDEHWRKESNNYMEQIGVFVLVKETIDTLNNGYENVFKTMSDEIVSTLHHLFLRKAITTEQYEQMMYFNQVPTHRFNKLYFIPEVCHKEIILQPMLTSFVQEPMKAIARFLNILLEPIDRQITRSISFTTPTDAIQAFEKYAQQGFLRSTTLFVTIQIHDFSTIFSHDFMIEALKHFLQNHVPNEQTQGISTTTIVQLVQLILRNQYFLYENKLYQQITGAPSNTQLTQTLANIYLLYLQQDFVSILNNKKEIFGRCLNHIIFTWNESKDELQMLLNQNIIDHFKTSHIRITTDIGHEIHYFDSKITHDEGILQTNVYHKPNIEPYALPFVYDTTQRQDHLFLLRAALIRAILYCSNVDEFENERFYIELSFLINDASLDFIQQTIQNFFSEFRSYGMNMHLDGAIYHILRQNVQKEYHRKRTKTHTRQKKTTAKTTTITNCTNELK